MFKLLKNGQCYTPEYIGKKDILLVYDKIHKIADSISPDSELNFEVIDCAGKLIWPGLIDQHVHITGGGGENGPSSLIPEISIKDIVSAGVTTVVGLLGFNGLSRNMEGLIAKARALNIEGITSYIYAGNYGIPTRTLTGKLSTDIFYINEIIGVGEIAIADYRSSHPTLDMLKEIAYEAKLGGMLSGKAGIVHIHVGDGKEGLSPLTELIEKSNFPINMFVPTHTNRNDKLFKQAVEYYKSGGNIDLTAGENKEPGIAVWSALNELNNIKALDNVTVSSDGNGSIPSDNNTLKIGRVSQLFLDIKQSIFERNLDMSKVLKTVTTNPAKLLNIYPKKGLISEGSDADILILNKGNLNLEHVIANGNFLK